MIQYDDKHFLIDLESNYTITINNELGNLVNFQETKEIPFQRWYPYREGYSYRIVDYFIERFGIKNKILDPFVGSGSSILAGRLHGLEVTGIDVNPLATFIAKVENRQYNENDLDSIYHYLDKLSEVQPDEKIRQSNFNLEDRYFNSEILQSLLQLKDYIKDIPNNKIQDLFYLAWLSILETLSYVKKEGNGLKYKTRKRYKNKYTEIPKEEWDKLHYPDDKYEFVRNSLFEKIDVFIKDISLHILEAPTADIIQGDCIEITESIDELFQLTIFSPPYVNFFDYFEIHKIELWMGDFVSSRKEFKDLKSLGLRSNGNVSSDTAIEYENPTVQYITDIISTKKLWSNKIPTVIEAYFDDMRKLLENLYNKTEEKGYVCIIVGNSAYAGTLVPTDLLLAEISESLGFTVEEIIVTRYLTTSSQQKKQLEEVEDFLRESIVVLRKE